jgi:CRP/FNR family transcriptional regulator, cyclic AMP receptor protein
VASLAALQRAAAFDVEAFLQSSDAATSVTLGGRAQVLFSQGDPADSVFYIQEGSVMLSVLSRGGKEAVVAIFGVGDFVGEGALAGQTVRIASAKAAGPTRLLEIGKAAMLRLLHEQHGFSDRFITYIVSRNMRVESDLVDQLFNRSEKRLARVLLLLARYGTADETRRVLPRISQEVLAEMVGTTRSRVNFFMNKFRKLGLIEYNGDIVVHDSLLTVVLHD